MVPQLPSQLVRAPPLGAGQTVLKPLEQIHIPSGESRSLYRLSDPALSELGVEELLDTLLLRVRDALAVDTVAVLLFDAESNQLVARAAKGIEEEVEQGVRIPIGQGFAGRIAAERVAIFIADVDHADILNPILREKGIRSLLGVPLVVAGQLIGVLHVGSLHPREFGQRDLAILELAAARVGPGIERARLYAALEHEHRVAMVLQRSLLPKRLPRVSGVSMAARYLPARAEVGGDWYDVIQLPSGMLGVAIGDVVGHGTPAAALMGQLRTALRAYALEGNSPGRTLELVDRFVQNAGSGMATAAYATFDTETSELCFALAGHPPPIVLANENSRVLEAMPATPLGAFPYSHCPEHILTLADGEAFVLYTDGLVERPGVAVGEGIDELLAVIRDAESAEDACQLAFDALVPPGGLRDDVAILALQSVEVPQRLHLRLPAEARVLSEMRRVLRRWLREHGANENEIVEITIAVGEACANAIEHAYSPGPATFELEAGEVDRLVTVVVRDEGRWRAPRGHHRGRGLGIMSAAMDDVEVDRGDGTRVELRRRLEAR
jgi:anti-sigma regulatory factor (Ser/Thr protein kinase)/putative methionine-R-sulfoxide reductase with GAF domain